MSKGLKILIGLIVLLILVSTSMYITSLFYSRGSFSVKGKARTLANIEESGEIKIDEYYDVDFSNIKVVATASIVEINTSSDKKVHVSIYSDEKRNKVYLDKDTLTVKTKNKRCRFFCIKQDVSKVVITIPENQSLDIDINNKLGNIFLGNLENSKINIKINAGDVKVENAKELRVENNLGNIKVAGKVDYLDATLDCGDIKINEAGTALITNHLGDVFAEQINKRVDINNDCGDIKLNNLTIKENSTVNNSMGEIEIGNVNDIKIISKTSLGENKVNNSNNNSNIELTINNSFGDIRVNN